VLCPGGAPATAEGGAPLGGASGIGAGAAGAIAGLMPLSRESC